MLTRILPLITALILVICFALVVHMKRKKGVVYFEWNRKISIGLALPILSLHIAFSLYFAIHDGAYLYLLHSDLCTMLYPWVTICLIMDKKGVLKVLLPLMITGGFFELATQKMTFGHGVLFDEISSYLKHTLLLIAGIYIYINLKEYSWKHFGYSLIWMLCFCLYIVIVTGIPYWVTGNEKFGTFSMGIIPTSYREVNVSWNSDPYILSEYKVLAGFGYPFGTISLLLAATLFSAVQSLGAVISSKYKTTTRNAVQVKQ